MFNSVLGGILEVFKSVPFELHATKPPGDAHHAVGDIFFLKDTKDEQASTYFPVVTLSFINGSVMAEAGGLAVVVGFGVFLLSF